MISAEIVALLLLLAGASVIQFFRGRKTNLSLVEFYARKSVEAFKPVDKTYTWLGGYIGYKASFKLADGLTLEYTLTLLPRHSLLYFPISLLTNRHDKLFLVFRLKKLYCEAHLIKKNYYRFRPKIEDEIALKREFTKLGGHEYELLYDNKKCSDWILNFVRGFSKIENVKHVSLTQSTRVLYIQMKPEIETIERDLKHIYNYIRTNLQKIET